jgi:hypothetical protein
LPQAKQTLLVFFRIKPVNRLYATQTFEPAHQFVRLFFVVHIHFYVAFKQAIAAFDGKGIDVDAHVAANDVGYFIDNTHIIEPNDFNTGEKSDVFVFGPLGFTTRWP